MAPLKTLYPHLYHQNKDDFLNAYNQAILWNMSQAVIMEFLLVISLSGRSHARLLCRSIFYKQISILLGIIIALFLSSRTHHTT